MATCANSVGSFTCQCPLGYKGDGFTCTLIESCSDNPCVHGSCVQDTPYVPGASERASERERERERERDRERSPNRMEKWGTKFSS